MGHVSTWFHPHISARWDARSTRLGPSTHSPTVTALCDTNTPTTSPTQLHRGPLARDAPVLPRSYQILGRDSRFLLGRRDLGIPRPNQNPDRGCPRPQESSDLAHQAASSTSSILGACQMLPELLRHRECGYLGRQPASGLQPSERCHKQQSAPRRSKSINSPTQQVHRRNYSSQERVHDARTNQPAILPGVTSISVHHPSVDAWWDGLRPAHSVPGSCFSRDWFPVPTACDRTMSPRKCSVRGSAPPTRPPPASPSIQPEPPRKASRNGTRLTTRSPWILLSWFTSL